MKNTAIFTLLLFSLELFAVNLNTVLNDGDGFIMGTNKPVLVNNRIIFNGRVEGDASVWSFNPQTLEKQVLFEGSAITANLTQPFQVVGPYAYFVGFSGIDYSSTVWRTDGTAAGTVQLFNNSIASGIYQNNGYIFAETYDQELLVAASDESGEMVLHEVNAYNLNSTCVFDINNIIVLASNSDNRPYKQSRNGVVSTFDITVLPPTEISLSQTVFHDNSCLTIASDGDDVWQINPDGALVSLNSVINSDKTFQLMSHQNRLYARTSDSAFGTVKRFDAALNEIDATLSDPENSSIAITAMKSMGEIIGISTTTPTISPQIDAVSFYSSDLQPIADSTITFIDLPNHHTSSDTSILEITRGSLTNDDISLVLNPFEPDEVTVNLPDGLTTVITSSNNQQIWVQSTQDSNDSVLYVLQETPNIGPIISGHWFNPSIENQGLNIHQGTRADGSKYVSVTGYTFKDGLPFWFAGNTDLTMPQSSIEMDLFEFSGIDMFEAENTPDRLLYGTITLQMQSCNQLNSLITTAEEQFDMLLYRIDDVTFNQNCVD